MIYDGKLTNVQLIGWSCAQEGALLIYLCVYLWVVLFTLSQASLFAHKLQD